MIYYIDVKKKKPYSVATKFSTYSVQSMSKNVVAIDFLTVAPPEAKLTAIWSWRLMANWLVTLYSRAERVSGWVDDRVSEWGKE